MEVLLAIVLVARSSRPGSRCRCGGARRPRRSRGLEDPRLAELEARKQAKYREIRDTELDHAQDKLSDEEFARQDAELRREAIAILKEIDDAPQVANGPARRSSRLPPPWRPFSE